jgi:GWxTD domain-containing protein
MNDLYVILPDDYYMRIDNLTDEAQVNSLLNDFWNNEYPNNVEAKNEYMKRLEFANLHYPDEYGWGRSDRKRIYLTYGAPDYIDRNDWTSIPTKKFARITSTEVWHYGRPGKNNSFPTILRDNYNGEMKFVFGDVTGCGHYQILDSSEDPGDIDSRVTR